MNYTTLTGNSNVLVLSTVKYRPPLRYATFSQLYYTNITLKGHFLTTVARPGLIKKYPLIMPPPT